MLRRYAPMEIKWLRPGWTARPCPPSCGRSCTGTRDHDRFGRTGRSEHLSNTPPKYRQRFCQSHRAVFAPHKCFGLDETRGSATTRTRLGWNPTGRAIDILLKSEETENVPTFANYDARTFNRDQRPSRFSLAAGSRRLDAIAAIDVLGTWSLKVCRRDLRHWRGNGSPSFRDHHNRATTTSRQPDFSPASLLRLVRLAYRHVRPSGRLPA